MKRKYKPGGPDMSACQGRDGDHFCDKREFCERYTGGPESPYVDRLEFPGIYSNRCSYFVPNTEGQKRYFEKVGEWEF
jgi:hypothetical protein